jgi:NAD(P)-dependent dehydrogenase (short-subunit alcohol dehydrogenase family)
MLEGASKKRTVVVTGAASGIGYALATLLLEKGYRVCAWDIVSGWLDGNNHRSLSFRQIDVRDKTAMDEALAVEEEISAGICGLATCAAIFKRVPFLELDDQTWDQHFGVNLKGSLLACQAVLPKMLRAGGGSIVLFSSSLARTGSPTGAHYAATKGGVLGLMRSLALELARSGIRVNSLSPGITDTPQPRAHTSEEEFYAKAKSVPLGRLGRSEEMAQAALFLLENESSFVTGQDIRVNGGSQIS